MQRTNVTLFRIPIGTPAAICRHSGCRARIFWVITRKGKRLALRTEKTAFYRKKGETIDVPEAREPGAGIEGIGWAHFIDCPGTDEFHRLGRMRGARS